MKLHLPHLLAALDRADLDQKALALRIGWSEAKVSRLVNGKTKDVTLTMLKDLERELGASAAFLLDLKEAAQTDAEVELLRNYRAAQARDRRIAEAALKPDKGD